jgi:hypothetical protein
MKVLPALLLSALLAVTTSTYAEEALLLYGGDYHDQFLGCINCSDTSKVSIWNTLGKYGNDLNSDCIWNSLGKYGNNISSYSPWNSTASYPPIIVDQQGRSYGYLTANSWKNPSKLGIAQILIEYHEQIARDVDGWYRKIFQ